MPAAALDPAKACGGSLRRERSSPRRPAFWPALVTAVVAAPLGMALSPSTLPPPPAASGPVARYPEKVSAPSRIAVADIAANGIAHPAVHSMFAVSRPMRYGEFVWNDAGVPQGPRWILIDVTAQVISAFRAGEEIGTAVIVYGSDSKETPLGRFPILAKARQHRSTLYDADMPFTLRLTGDGVSIHASEVTRGAATHGCIGVPPKFAAALFEEFAKGDLVVIVR